MSAELTAEERAALERAAEIRAWKRDARERRRAEGAPPPEGGPTGRSVTFKADLEEP